MNRLLEYCRKAAEIAVLIIQLLIGIKTLMGA